MTKVKKFIHKIGTYSFLIKAIFTIIILLTTAVELNSMENKHSKSKKKYNRLIKEKSPYLLQHAQNPVDWYPWGEEAFEKARRENKPVFLSIGYSTCHWCHVMAHESFDDPEVAKRMNELFVCIKVDREERPDIDNVYMNVAQIMTGGGGWPLNIIMTPDKKPFFAGTYIPKESRYGRVGMMGLMMQVEELWTARRDEVNSQADMITNILGQLEQGEGGHELSQSLLQLTYRQLLDSFDKQYGGFGNAPKFPRPHNLFFLLRYWKRTGNKMSLQMVENTLDEMRRGGIYDHVGFGVHRYSTDERWLVPHFEKMLYDQALLALAYIEAYQATGHERHKKTAEEIFTYVLRDMTSKEGAFFTAEDADSEGEEGLFYLWHEDEIKKVLGKEEAAFISRVFNVEKAGNYIDSVERKKTAKNILHLKSSLSGIAKKEKISEKELVKRIEESRIKLFSFRKKRIHPYKDDKILTDWNGLMIAAFARGAQAFGNNEYKLAAKRASRFILKNLRKKNGRLLHRYRGGEAGIEATVDDYAFLIFGLIELYQAGYEASFLKNAMALQEDMNEYFWDDKKGGFFLTADDGEKLLLRPKEIYDGALPSGNSLAMSNLLRLARMTGNSSLETKAAKLGAAFSKKINKSPSAYTQLLSALDFAVGPSYEVVITGKAEDKQTKEMLESLEKNFLPNKVVIFKESSEKAQHIVKLAPFTKHYSGIDGKTTAYVCQNFSCSLPVTDKGKMLELLRK